ncbi:RNA polymerase sigma factor [Cyclobacterium plantarum]|uniref:RNA polymerase sigma factor n=1 Tax=Cyclobacterium plantarum TaxID=2716263 RepID=A0ABX0H5V2_9BACT|nr:RNA polymerase sigma factor [Cyclobacterium plantarum]NHE57240.1 RNA polymerase sigma factor [Cyclobacterium plantarum]
MKKRQLENLLKEFHQEAYHWSRQCCSFDEDLAKDVLQQVYLKILEGKAIYKEKSQIKTWLFSVIRFTALEWKKKVKNTYSLEAEFDVAETEQEIDTASHEELIEKLTERQREVLLLVFYHNLTLEKAAEIMEISIGSVRTHYDRGKRNLKALILKKTLHENNR